MENILKAYAANEKNKNWERMIKNYIVEKKIFDLNLKEIIQE